MKKFLALTVITALLVAVAILPTGCTTTTSVTAGPNGTTVTNVVKTIDPVRLQQARDALEPAAASVLRRAIINSPQHAQQIGDYARAFGGVFCKMVANNNFNPTYLIDAANAATANLQANVSADVIDGKNAAIALYKIFYGDQLTFQLPNNQWPTAICQLFCDSIDQALRDAGQPGLK